MPESLYLKIREERIRQGLSQKELGDMVGLPQQAINRIEQGQRKLDIEIFEKLCNALKIKKIGNFSVNFICSYYNTDADENIDLSEEPVEEPVEGPQTTAAHFDGDEYTEEELEQIRQFAEFVKSKRKINQLNAAHADDYANATEELKKQEEDIMDDENF